MAKNTKSLKEQLEDAQILYEKPPYEIPKNWVWTILDYSADYKKGPFGSSITKAMFVPKGENTYKVYEQGNAINKTVQYGKYYINSKKYEELISCAIKPKDIIVSCAGTIGEIFQLPDCCEEGIINQALMRIRLNKHVNEKYYIYYFGQIINDSLNSYSKGTAIKNIPPFDIMKKIPFPLPPLAEQERIAARIENLFRQLDRAEDIIENAIDSFAERKSVILYKAFTGDLTKQWREIKKVSLDSWEEKSLKNVCSFITDGTHQTPTYTEEGYIFLSSKNVKSGKVDWENVKYIPDDLHKELYARVKPQLNDLLLAKNGTTGTAALVDRDCIFDVYVSLAILRPNLNFVEPKYLLYAINNPITKEKFNVELKGIGVPNLHLVSIRTTTIPVPKITEQEEIVRILDSIFEKEDESKELINLLDQIEVMKKTILAKAFRGQLNTNNSTDEPAVKLLERIIEERNAAEKNKANKSANAPIKRRIPKEIEAKFSTNIEMKIYKLLFDNNGEQTIDYIAEYFPLTSILDLLEAIELMEKKELLIYNEETRLVKLIN